MTALRIAVVGGAGYVGLHVVDALVRRGHTVTAVVRRDSGLLRFPSGVTMCSNETARRAGPFDAVVNLAFPTGDDMAIRAANVRLANLLTGLAGADGHLVHVSTQAVFGLALDRPVTLGAVEPIRDVAYVESKIQVERLLLAARPQRLSIVRLGNVWGPGSPNWTGTLVSRMLFGRPVGVDGSEAFSNVTDVANIADYLSFLCERGWTDGNLLFHHLAEFSGVRWPWWTARIGHVLGVDPVTVPSLPAEASGLPGELKNVLRIHSPLLIIRQLRQSRQWGSVSRRALGVLPDSTFKWLKRTGAPSVVSSSIHLSPDDEQLLRILSGPQQFCLNVANSWEPCVSLEESWERTVRWMQSAGYLR